MNKDKKVLYITSLITFAVLLISLFVDIGSSKIVAACLLLPISVAVCLLIKKRGSLSVKKREVLLIVTVISIIYVVLKQLTGIYFGYYKNPYFINLDKFLRFVLPITVAIITVEIIRYVFLAQKNVFVDIITYLSCVIVEILMFSNLSGITTFNKFMDLVGLTLFPALTTNIFYHFISKRYGAIPNIVFRSITTLFVYFTPNVAGLPDSLSSCISIVLPIILLAFIAALFEKKKKYAKKKGKVLSTISTVLTIVIITSVAMLISCQFRFGAIVIATESMTGEINKGDMILYERYDDQAIKEGQVIVFRKSNSRIVHRVVKIENIGGELRYYTKGDANSMIDSGYITEADIVGLTDIKIAYIGFPTLWLRKLLESS